MAPLYQAVDAHTHLDFPAFDADRDEVLQRARDAGIEGWIVAGADPAHWARVRALVDAIGGACCLGVHPWWVADRTEDQLQADLDALAVAPDLDGIGETGLDWVRARDPEGRGLQQAVFAAHVELAHQRGLPLVLHVVRAHAEALGMLAAMDVPAAGGLVHAWSAGPEHVEIAVELGLHLSFGSALLKSDKVRAALAAVPDDRLLLETDCPDQPIPGSERGEPAHLVAIATAAAEIRDTPVDRLLALTGDNARTLFPALLSDEDDR